MTYPTCTGVACPTGEPTLQVDHGYDAGFLTSLTNPSGTNWIPAIEYHANGLWSQIDRSNGWRDLQTVASHGMQRPLEIQAQNAAQQVQYTTGPFGYDGAGNVKGMGADSFDYDPQQRLVGGTISGGSYSFTYDPYGNLSSYSAPTGTVSICIDSQKNRIAETPPGGCMLLADQDDFGNVTELQGFEYEYDALDMLIHRNPTPGAPEHTYVYTADDERLWFINADGGPPPGDFGSTGGSLITSWEGLFLRDLSGKLLRQYSKATGFAFEPQDGVYGYPFGVSRDYIHRNGQLAAIQGGFGGITHHHLDHLGTPRAISNASGALASTHKYTPYGKELGSSSGNALQFTGHERDSHGRGEDDNLDYMHARFYSVHVGRFLSVDPYDRYSPTGSTQLWNRYTYTKGNPLKYSDPNGELLALPYNDQIAQAWDLLVGVASSAAGKALLEDIIANPAGLATFQVALVGDRTVRQYQSRGLAGLDPGSIPFGDAFPTRTTPSGVLAGAVDVTVNLDLAQALHPWDRTGVWTAGHEFYHASGLLRGIPAGIVDREDHRGGPGTSPADRFGRSVRFGRPASFAGRSESQVMALNSYARAWLEKRLQDSWLAFGQRIVGALSGGF